MAQSSHLTRHVLMVRPARFGFNKETSKNNAFQTSEGTLTAKEVQKKAKKEFDNFVRLLSNAGINVIVAKDGANPPKPDAVFPNNWVTFHPVGRVITYPMFAESRRPERRAAVLHIVQSAGFPMVSRKNLEYNEILETYLEGTGSIVFDHIHKLAYACLSPRTHEDVLDELCTYLGYEKVVFNAKDGNGIPIYHTNVMLSVGTDFVVVCMESVEEKSMLKKLFKKTGKKIIEITREQMKSFAGNMIQLKNDKEESILVMSEQAHKSLDVKQIKKMEEHAKLLVVPLYTIERYGGGSARCMIAEVFM